MNPEWGWLSNRSNAAPYSGGPSPSQAISLTPTSPIPPRALLRIGEQVNRAGGTVSIENYNATTHGLGEEGPWTRVEDGQRVNFHPPQSTTPSNEDCVPCVTFHSATWLYLLNSLCVLGLTIGLVVSQPSGGSPAEVNFTVFVVIFSYLSLLVYTALLLIPRAVFWILAGLNLVFYFSASMGMTLALLPNAIGPSGDCNDLDYISNNDLISGVTSRCRIAQADVAFLWFSTLSFILSVCLTWKKRKSFEDENV